MPKFAANLSMMFTELPFLERFGAAAEAGFKAVEYLFPYEFAAEDIAAKLREHGLSQALFNCPPGDWQAGERGLASLAGREQAFRDSIDQALRYAEALDCSRLHVMAGLREQDEKGRETYISNLRYAAERFAEHGRTALIEPINSRDIPGYFLNYSHQAVAVIDAVGAANLGLQLDLYHCQIMEGDLAEHLRALKDVTRHIQIAGVPGRHEPDVGEIHYPYLFERMDELGYAVWVGCEYRPRGETAAGLGWYKNYRQ